MTKKIVISGYYGFGNYGDEAILSVLVSRLKYLQQDIIVLSSNPRKTSIDLYVNSLNSFDLIHVLGVIKDCDILISGGGSLLQDVTSLKSLVYYLGVIFMALLHRKKVIIFSQGIGPINNPIACFFTSIILKRCDFISVRDESSQNLLHEWGINSTLVCDPVFSANLNMISQKGIVGVQLRNFPTMSEEFMYKLARQIIKDFHDKKIEIFSLQDSLDLEICKRFEAILRSLQPNISAEVVNEYITDRISKLEYMIAMRFHALVVALKMGIKCTGINYDIKVEKLCREANIPLINMDKSYDFEIAFKELKALDCVKLKKYADSKVFDWSYIDGAITN